MGRLRYLQICRLVFSLSVVQCTKFVFILREETNLVGSVKIKYFMDNISELYVVIFRMTVLKVNINFPEMNVEMLPLKQAILEFDYAI